VNIFFILSSTIVPILKIIYEFYLSEYKIKRLFHQPKNFLPSTNNLLITQALVSHLEISSAFLKKKRDENYKIKETPIDIETFPSLARLQTNPFLVPSSKQMFPSILNQ
jgi:hypothetical protein